MKATQKIRWAIMGTGRVAQLFMADLRHVPGTELSAIASRTENRARQTADRFGVKAAYGSYEALARDPNVDVVYVATDHHLHAQHCNLALDNGKHVLCEKPFACSADEAAHVIDKARRLGLFCMEAMWTRFLPAALEMRRRVGAGEIGSARMLSADFGIPVDETVADRFFDAHRGGGALLDRGVYAISLAIWLFGEPQVIECQVQLHGSGVDNSVTALLRFAEDRLATVAASLGAYTSNEAVVAGSTGRIRLHEPFYRPERLSLRPYSRQSASAAFELQPSSTKEMLKRAVSRVKPYLPLDRLRSSVLYFPVRGYGYGYEIEEVVKCLREGTKESPIMPLSETLLVCKAVDTIKAQIKAARTAGE